MFSHYEILFCHAEFLDFVKFCDFEFWWYLKKNNIVTVIFLGFHNLNFWVLSQFKLSLVINNPSPPKKKQFFTYHMLHVMCPLSHVTCPLSNVTCPLSPFNNTNCHRPTAKDPPPANCPTILSRLVLTFKNKSVKIQHMGDTESLGACG